MFVLRSSVTDLTKQYITEAMLLLMEQKPFHEITVTEIAKKAGVGRATFYRNFDTKESILLYHFNGVVEELLSDRRFVPRCDEDYYDTMLSVLRVMKKSQHVVRLLIDSNLDHLLLQYLNQRYAMFFEDEAQPQNELLSYFYAGATYNITVQWVKRDCDVPLEKVAETLFLASFGESKYKALMERMHQ